MTRKSLENCIKVFRALFDRCSGEVFRSASYEDARARTLLRVAELEQAIARTMDGKLRLITANSMFTVEPDYVLALDRESGEYVFAIFFMAKQKGVTLGIISTYDMLDGWMVLHLDTWIRSSAKLLVPTPDRVNMFPAETMEISAILKEIFEKMDGGRAP